MEGTGFVLNAGSRIELQPLSSHDHLDVLKSHQVMQLCMCMFCIVYSIQVVNQN